MSCFMLLWYLKLFENYLHSTVGKVAELQTARIQ